MDIQVNGDGNRVAGRDYYELKLKPCPQCEIRVIEPDACICNHCRRQREEENAKAIISLIACALAAAFFGLLKLRSELGIDTRLEDIPGVVFVAALTVGTCCFVVWLIYEWLRFKS